jgi:hypothetical protein
MKLEHVIPIPVQRRLLLGLSGFRREGREWVLGSERLHEERLDAMDNVQWQHYMSRWLASAVSAN